MFRVQFEEYKCWSPCHLEYGSVWLVVDVEVSDPMNERITAKLLSLTKLNCEPRWIEGTFKEWRTLDKLS